MGQVVELHLALRRGGEDAVYQTEWNVRTRDEVKKPRKGQAQIDTTRLLSLEADPKTYAETLTGMLFSDRELCLSLENALEKAGEGTVRLRLAIEESASELQLLQWERLCLPETNQPLSTRDDIVFSRYLEVGRTPDPVEIRKKIRVLVAIAAPTNLQIYNLHPIDREAEKKRAARGLKGLRLVHLPAPCTLDALAEKISGYDVLFLVCHGRQGKQGHALALEGERGNTVFVPDAVLETRLAGAKGLPRLVVLSVCKSSSGLGPALLRAGVPAVVVMQGDLSFRTARDFFPKLFHELAKHGIIDQAVAAARRKVSGSGDFAVPVLLMALANGQLWEIERPRFRWLALATGLALLVLLMALFAFKRIPSFWMDQPTPPSPAQTMVYMPTRVEGATVVVTPSLTLSPTPYPSVTPTLSPTPSPTATGTPSPSPSATLTHRIVATTAKPVATDTTTGNPPGDTPVDPVVTAPEP